MVVENAQDFQRVEFLRPYARAPSQAARAMPRHGDPQARTTLSVRECCRVREPPEAGSKTHAYFVRETPAYLGS
jgi:hypothetical protein